MATDDKSLIEKGEWERWARYFGKMFPTASPQWIEQMCQRIVRTLGYNSPVRTMEREDYLARLRQLRDAINFLPPDSGNKLMGGV